MPWSPRFAVVLAAVGLITACGTRSPSASSPPQTAPGSPAVTSMTVQEFRAVVEDTSVTLVNVHVPDEGRIPGTDLEIPFDRIADAAGQLPTERAAPLAVYCMSGRMSEIAAETLRGLGYTRIYNLTGGMLAWEAANLPLED